MSIPAEFELTASPKALVEDVAVEASANDEYRLEAGARDQVFIDVIHDGDWIPQEFLEDRTGKPISFEKIQADYVRERDWGACAIAAELASRLGVPTYTRVNVARVLMDFGRFPGSTPKKADHLHRFAINFPFSELLSYPKKKLLLEEYYDQVSVALESRLANRLTKIAVHTYDQYNESGTERPAASILTRSIGYQTESEIPAGLFDPLYPDVLAEFTADRILRDRLSLTLEKHHIAVAHNYPYCLPEGSLEVRYQVWSFFRALRDAYEAEFPETADDHSHELVWAMLFDTNLRSSESDALRGYLHMYRRAPEGRRQEFLQASEAYDSVARFCQSRRSEVVDRYRFSPKRRSSLGLEIRKDIVADLDEDGNPRGIKWDNVEYVGDALAHAIAVYFRTDRAAHADSAARHDLERSTSWFKGLP